jgi:hypothetical protein
VVKRREGTCSESCLPSHSHWGAPEAGQARLLPALLSPEGGAVAVMESVRKQGGGHTCGVRGGPPRGWTRPTLPAQAAVC